MSDRGFQSVPVLEDIFRVLLDVAFSSYPTKFSAVGYSPVTDLYQGSWRFLCVRGPCVCSKLLLSYKGELVLGCPVAYSLGYYLHCP